MNGHAKNDVLDSVRPTTLSQFVGQKRIKDILRVNVSAAKKRGAAMGHTLFVGPPGYGKTSLAAILAHELGVQFHRVHGPTIEKTGELAYVLMKLGARDVLFIDEMHRLNARTAELLYPVMEDYIMTYVDPSAEEGKATQKIDIKPFTLVGATTRASSLAAPLRDRFPNKIEIGFYSKDDIKTIIKHSAQKLKITIQPGAIDAIASRARNTPRIANNLLAWARDFSLVHGRRVITKPTVLGAMKMQQIDENGLGITDRLLLNVLIERFNGRPVGIKTLAACFNEEQDTIEEIWEPYLLQEGFIERTPKGRVATPRAFKALKKYDLVEIRAAS